jgi:NTP pyrophosphatase (non-canonical NTP hydrolase)
VSSDDAHITLSVDASMAEYQQYIHELEGMHGWLDADLIKNGFLMGEEFGELLQAMRAVHRRLEQGVARSALPEPMIDHVGEEIVDVLNYLLAIANRLDIDVEKAFREKNHRNQSRSWD